MMSRIHRFDSLASTNSRMAQMAGGLRHGDIVICREQTAGRGQRGNSWEAAPGANLTFSLMLRPRVLPPARSFEMSMAVSVGIVRALRDILGKEILIKWPNDIYAGDLKLAGILIENSFSGNAIDHAIVGIGLNVNQTVFVSDAPNPVSMAQIAGRMFDLGTVLDAVAGSIISTFDAYEDAPCPSRLSAIYHSMLWRREGTHRWLDNLTGETLLAPLARVETSGHLVLATEPPRRYAFKEITALLD